MDRRLALALAAASFVIAAFTAPAMAQDGFEQRMIRGVLSGIGLVAPDAPSIDYRERAPLVVPKNRSTLPPPQTSASRRNPNWPVDANTARDDGMASWTNSSNTTGRRLSDSELRAGARPYGGRVSTPISDDRPQRPLLPSELNSKPLSEIWFGSAAAKSETLTFTGEGERRALTEPPPGYRTPSPKAAYGPKGLVPYDPQSPQAKAATSSTGPTR